MFPFAIGWAVWKNNLQILILLIFIMFWQAWAKEDLLREQNKELANFRYWPVCLTFFTALLSFFPIMHAELLHWIYLNVMKYSCFTIA